MSYLGDYNLSTVLYTKFTTVNGSGLPTTLSDAPTFGFYQDANVTLFTAGVTGTIDFNTTTGLNHLQLTVTTSATGIAAGSSYQLVVATGSVSGVTMKGYVVGEFSVLTRSPLRPTTAGRTLLVNASGATAIDWGAVSNPGTTVGLSATTLFVVSNANVSSISTIANANVTSISTVVNANVTSISTVVPANVTAYSTAIAANITAQSIVINANVTSISTVVNANVTSISTVVNANVTSLSTGVSVSGVVNANVTSISTVVNANVTSVGASALTAIQSGLATPTNITAGTFTTLSGNVGGNVTGSIGSLATQAKTDAENAIWEALAASHNNANTMGNKLNSAASAGDPWGTALPGAYGAGTAGNIVGNNLDAAVSTRSTFAGGAVSSVTGNVGGNVTGSVASVVAIVTVDVKKVNGVTVNGSGTAVNPWGP